MNSKMRKEKQKKSKTMQSWERMETWPPTTAMAGKASQRVGKALSSPWSPRAVQALCILFTNEIRFSIQTYYSEIQRNEAFLGFFGFFEFCWDRKEWRSLAKEPRSERFVRAILRNFSKCLLALKFLTKNKQKDMLDQISIMYWLLHLRSATSLKLHWWSNVLCITFCVHSIFHKSLIIMYVITFYFKL